MPYIDATYLNEALGDEKVTKLTAGNERQLTRMIKQATAATRSALSIGGYSGAIPETVYAAVSDCPEEISLACMGAFVELAYGANDLEIPEGYRGYIAMLEELKAGKMELATVTRNVARAVGGVSFTDSSSTSDGGRPQVFGRKAMSGF